MWTRVKLASIISGLLIYGVVGLDRNVNLAQAGNSSTLETLPKTGSKDALTSHEGKEPNRAIDETARIETNISQPEMTPEEQARLETDTVRCRDSAKHVKASLEEKRLWALHMLDATGKPESGLLNGNTRWLGSYTQCHRVKVQIPFLNDEPLVAPFSTKYCTVVADVDTHMPTGKITASLGVCAPTTCRGKPLVDVINEGNYILPNGTVAFTARCEPMLQIVKWETKQILLVVLLAVICLLVLCGTLYDFLIYQPAVKAMISTENTTNRKVTEELDHGFGQYVLAFSAYTNGRKILSMSSKSSVLDVTNGIRVLGMAWVTMQHLFMTSMLNSYDQVYMLTYSMTFVGQIISNGHFSVDVFFTLSGFVLAYMALQKLEETKGQCNWIHYYVHRYIRLTPTLLILVLLVQSNFLQLLKGPTMNSLKLINSRNCTLWTNLLYINNIYKIHDTCYATTWYLGNDFQFFAISPLLLIPLYRWPKQGARLLMFVLATSMVITGAICYNKGLPPGFFWRASAMIRMPGAPGLANEVDYYLYYAPYARIGPYLVGMYTAFLLHRNKSKTPPTKNGLFVGWCLTLLGIYLCLFGLHPNEAQGDPINVYLGVLYNAVSRAAWGACISWIIYVCSTGKGGLINAFLSWELFQPLSRLCYMMYLIHVPVHNVLVRCMQYLPYFDVYFVGTSLLAVLFLSVIASFFASLLIETPFVSLEYAIIRQIQQRKETNEIQKKK